MGTRKTALKARTEQAALVAQLGRVVGVDPDHFQAPTFSFVLDKALKLKEAPVAYPIVHSLSKPSSPDSIEVFHHYFISFKRGNNPFAYVVVNPSHEPFLPATQLPEKLFRRASAFSLKNRTQMLKLPLNLLNFGGVEEPAVACDSEIVNSEINAKNMFSRSIVNGSNLFKEPKQEETFTFSIDTQEALGQLPTFEVRRKRRSINKNE